MGNAKRDDAGGATKAIYAR